MKASVFKTNRTQAIRLPKALALPEGVKFVEVVAMGNSRLITPLGGSWDSWFDQPGVSEDFMSTRDQPEADAREDL